MDFQPNLKLRSTLFQNQPYNHVLSLHHYGVITSRNVSNLVDKFMPVAAQRVNNVWYQQFRVTFSVLPSDSFH